MHEGGTILAAWARPDSLLGSAQGEEGVGPDRQNAASPVLT